MFAAIRTLTCHGTVPPSGDGDAEEEGVRLTHQLFEVIFVWQDIVETEVAKEDLYGRFTVILSWPPDVEFSPVGKLNAFITEDGTVTPRFAEVIGSLIRAVLANTL